ncbi:hypothetical protein TEA_010916 [Camellia sinensis var. sinensis]|uniref:Uncharacterized protein n=1 Tax=Camellia sinensis var. sinensis TaxID=542762 RepID=A0A4V6RYR9_CAMSN|nr:hypothetical protein TEA_010916 [Camellia sinensis var. sinensis]
MKNGGLGLGLGFGGKRDRRRGRAGLAGTGTASELCPRSNIGSGLPPPLRGRPHPPGTPQATDSGAGTPPLAADHRGHAGGTPAAPSAADRTHLLSGYLLLLLLLLLTCLLDWAGPLNNTYSSTAIERKKERSRPWMQKSKECKEERDGKSKIEIEAEENYAHWVMMMRSRSVSVPVASDSSAGNMRSLET